MSWIWTVKASSGDEEKDLHDSVRVEWSRTKARKTPASEASDIQMEGEAECRVPSSQQSNRSKGIVAVDLSAGDTDQPPLADPADTNQDEGVDVVGGQAALIAEGGARTAAAATAKSKKKRKAARTSFADALEANFLSRFACTTACRRIIWDEYFQNATKASLDFVLPEGARCCEVWDPANFNHWGLGSHVQEIAVST
ncbi:hypothetical protein B0H14DRAFT_2621588 [Mycena olivaceomarginata]|nr:hypothetical protein B0H14DRAFT_2621588 [Mycena olivaceomarginata]